MKILIPRCSDCGKRKLPQARSVYAPRVMRCLRCHLAHADKHQPASDQAWRDGCIYLPAWQPKKGT